MRNSRVYEKYVVYLIVISTIVRGLIAYFLELGNDEVYYRLYAAYPDWSHFDHPLMVGLSIQLTTLNLLFQNEFFLRLSSVIIGSVNIWIIYKIGLFIRDARTGYFAALLYTASIYATIITGVFILPDTPQNLFWIWSIYLIIRTIPRCPRSALAGINMAKIGVLIGFGILSKYTSVFLWIGIGIYILVYNRDWLKSKWLYISIFISLLITLPIFIWNFQNDFISITFHSERVDMAGHSINFNYFFTEVLGEALYNNPIVTILIIITLVQVFRGKINLEKRHIAVLLLLGLPLIITFLVFSLYRSTLPHWTAPGYSSLIILAAAYISQKTPFEKKFIPIPILLSIILTALILIIGILQINFGIINLGKSSEYQHIGSDDPSLDMYGYKQVGVAFKNIVNEDVKTGEMGKSSIFVGSHWFPLANYDYYAATPAGLLSYGIGELDDIHKYAWINKINGGFKLGMDAYYITDSRLFHKPDQKFYDYFDTVTLSDTINIYRGGKVAKRAFVYQMKNLHTIPPDVLQK